MPTIIDVAREAGVSIATVSRVLSRTGVVAEATRSRVRAAIDRLGYQPNIAARTLRTLRAGKILVTVPDVSNPFFATVIRGAEEAARDAGYRWCWAIRGTTPNSRTNMRRCLRARRSTG